MEVVDLTEEPTKLDRDVRKKVEKAIARDKWSKVEKMVERGEVGVDTVVSKKGETMLHLAAKEEAEDRAEKAEQKVLPFILQIFCEKKVTLQKAQQRINCK